MHQHDSQNQEKAGQRRAVDLHLAPVRRGHRLRPARDHEAQQEAPPQVVPVLRALVACLLLCGCAGAQTALDDARSYVRQSGEELLRLHGIISAVCVEPEPDFCPELKESFNRVRDIYTRLNETIP